DDGWAGTDAAADAGARSATARSSAASTSSPDGRPRGSSASSATHSSSSAGGTSGAIALGRGTRATAAPALPPLSVPAGRPPSGLAPPGLPGLPGLPARPTGASLPATTARGSCPVSAWYSVTPTAYQSLASVAGAPARRSGDMYAG